MLFDRPFVTLPANRFGRDFCIGDLHGCWEMLRRLLDAVSFEYWRDRLFSVGDLVHRGPSSVRCLKLAEEDWFYPVTGNHEAMQMGAYNGAIYDGRSVARMCEYDGHNDPLRPGQPDQPHLEKVLGRLPLAMQFPLPDGRKVGIVHAGLPGTPWSWADLQAMTKRESNLYDKLGGMQKRILWDRQPVIAAAAALTLSQEKLHTLYPAATRYDFMQATRPVAGLDLLVSGHTSLRNKPLTISNRLYLDTGAGMPDGRLTMVQLGTERYWEVPDPRTDPEMPVTACEGFDHADAAISWLSDTETRTMEATQRRPPVDPLVRLFYPNLDDF